MSWEQSFIKEISDIRGDLSYEESSQRLRKLIKTELLKFTDLKHQPERFFQAHRLLAAKSPVLGPGFWIRFTVQYNLFAGTVLGLGNEKQIQQLNDMQKLGQLGCFGLTERLAGVNSGLIANTTATWVPEKQKFLLNSPNEGAYKNWISQGLTADKSVVVADLIINGKNYGPHAFLIDFRNNGNLIDGITIGDMGRKTIGNDLDNAWVCFKNVQISKDALLNRFADVIDNSYVQKVKGIKNMDMIGQRLFSGRIAVAQAAIQFTKQLFTLTKSYSDSKKCWAPNGLPNLTSIPQLSSIYKEAELKIKNLESFLSQCEKELSYCLKNDKFPETSLIQAIAAAKVRVVETCIDLCFRLKQEVGSYALMGNTGFENMDFLQCCKFAEGDSRILMQKITRDRLKSFESQKQITDDESKVCEKLQNAISSDMKIFKDKQQAWDNNWQLVYQLADMNIDKTIQGFLTMKPRL